MSATITEDSSRSHGSSVLQRMTEEQARAVYAVLTAEARAPLGHDAEASFVAEFTRDSPTNEWRFCGALGFGGKFRFPRMTVDCYREDETPERSERIKSTNAKLTALRHAWGVVEDELG